ncbi:MAG: M50 family metallopeptidase [Anaerolineales bacterium]|jgi:regulator of sigma E protease|nr:M50 family metallopeptidase [Anaerolineales bacterium]
MLAVLEFIAALAALIIIHEIGHFVACKIFKIEVEEFGLGFPPRLTRLFTWRNTEYTLNWIPLGGFVKPKGENDPTIPGSLAAASPWVRIGVYLAGPLSNLLVAVILYAIIISRVGFTDPNRVNEVLITGISASSPAEQAGLQANDRILQVNDVVIDSPEKLQETVYANLDQSITLSIQRGEEILDAVLVPRSDPPEGEGAIGILMGTPVMYVNPIQALPMGVVATYDHGAALLTMIGRLVTGSAPAEEGRLVGYKGMYDIYSGIRNSDTGSGYPAGVEVMGFFTSITISLGLLNLLPIPVVDGGRILFALPEILFRKRIPPKFENAVNFVSFALLILLLIFINLQDFINPIELTK